MWYLSYVDVYNVAHNIGRNPKPAGWVHSLEVGFWGYGGVLPGDIVDVYGAYWWRVETELHWCA